LIFFKDLFLLLLTIWVYGKPNHHVAKVMEKNWQGLQNIMLYRATADSLAYIGEDSSLDLFFDEFLSVPDPIKNEFFWTRWCVV
jgi:hypothetical protein